MFDQHNAVLLGHCERSYPGVLQGGSIHCIHIDHNEGMLMLLFGLLQDHKQRLGRWLVWGVVLGVVALGLCGGTQNGGAIPVAKNLWYFLACNDVCAVHCGHAC